MCHLLTYKSHTCPHRWVVLAQPCSPNVNFATAPSAGHRFTRPTTLFGGTQWFPAPPNSCPDCDLRGNYNGDKIRLYLGKGAAGERAGRAGLWGPYGNGFWAGNAGGSAGVGGYRGLGWGGWGSGRFGGWGGDGGGYAGYGAGGYVPGQLAVTGQGGYDWRGNWVGNPAAGGMVGPPRKTPGRYPGQGLLGCFGV